ncbi:hypothetical protein BVRB_7g156820 [Beta vulgaris subsp. vulgaris]|nr:hypothetical protein BVRB_7g156820 [Beta vulgaris subsp. vulgaris]
MSECVQCASIIANRYSGTRVLKLGLIQCSWDNKPVILPSERLTKHKDWSVMEKLSKSKVIRILRHERLFMNQRVLTKMGVFGSNAYDFSSRSRLKEGRDEHLEFDLQNSEENHEELKLGFISEKEASDNLRTRDSLNGEFGVLNFDEPLLEESKGRVPQTGDFMAREGNGENDNLELTDDQDEDLLQPKSKPKHKPKAKPESRSRKQLMKRSSIIAKQVIGIESASSLGFVSQLWVDTATWVVLEVEVRPNLLSSESGRFLLEDINKVGDVVLVQEENYALNDFRTVGLETLVGYNVVTPEQRNLGKVRGFTFNINSGTVESLELDAFGYSIIPSNLVSTYALFTEDVLGVNSDVIIVHEAAASRIQRLTKGFLGTKNTETSSMKLKYRDIEEEYTQPVKGRKSRRKSIKRKIYRGTRDLGDEFELPMDYM